MTQATHVLLTVSGGYTNESLEHWQVGIRWLLEPFDTLVSVPDTGTLDPWDVVDTSTERVETDWTIETSWIRSTTLEGAFNPDDWLNDQVAPAFMTNFGNPYSHHARVDRLKASPIDSAGHVVRDRTCVLSWTSANPAGGASGAQLPLETSSVVSWQTPRLGAKGRGRIYPPVMSTAQLDDDGNLTTAGADTAVAMWKAILEASSFLPPVTPGWGITPIVTGKPYSDFGTIRRLNIGNVIDVQRRRRRSLVEVRRGDVVTYS